MLIPRLSAMSHDTYRHHVTRAAAAVRHLGGAVRGSRAFFIYRDRSDASQPSIIACHPPLDDSAMLDCLGGAQLVWESVSDTDGNRAVLGLAADAGFENRELVAELTSLAAQSLAEERAALPAASRSMLPTRAVFVDRLDFALSGGHGGESDQVAALVVDIDHFHRVTARFGEAGGEDLMRILGTRLIDCLPPSTLVGRLGGDRFGVKIRVGRGGHTEERALVTAAEIQSALIAPVHLAGEDIDVTASIGIAIGGHDIQATTLLHDVDQAIAMAKRAGGATTRVFHPGMNNVPAFQLLRERDVRLAVGRDEFIPFFQPIVDAATGELRSFEALLRWQNPEEGMLPPSTFIDVLEETGLIEVVGRRVIRESCQQAAEWFELTGSLVPVSVNIAPVQLDSPDFCDHIAQSLAEHELPGEGLILELTESALVADKVKTHLTLQRLRDLGVRVRIDDFGTGFSALAYLHELPVSGIKLDRTWFRRIDSSVEQREIVRAIVALAHRMDMDVVAEGIETMSQLQRARELGCDFAQGFGFSKPLDAEHATRYLTGTSLQKAG
jgi:diguanylate cyclase (GGDEF)-like protein